MPASRLCVDCGAVIPQDRRPGGNRCAKHRGGYLTRQGALQQARDARRGTPSQRGYDHRHRQLRQQLLDAYQPTDPCPRCGRPLGSDPSMLDLGHTGDRAGWTGLEHRACNRAHRIRDM